MKLFLFLIVFCFTYLSADNSTEFNKKQELLISLKQVIQEEESIAKAYEYFLTNELKRPSSISALLTNDYLGTTFSSTFSEPMNTNYENYVLDNDSYSLNYRLKDNLIKDTDIKSLYESNIYRKKTFYYKYKEKNKIYFILEDNFAKNIYTLIDKSDTKTLINCGDAPKSKYCIKDDHMLIHEANDQSKLLYYYHIDNFETGPIIIINDASLYVTNDEFNSIPTGAALYNTDGVKYIKTSDSIEILK